LEWEQDERGRQQLRSSWDALEAIDDGNERQRTAGRGGINWSVEFQRCARQTKDENEPKRVAAQFAGPSIEHRTSLIFSLNLAQRMERGMSNPSLQSFEPDFFNRTVLKRQRTCRRSTTLQTRTSLSPTPPPDHPRPLTVLTGILPSAPSTNIRPASATQHTRHIKPVFCGNFA